jgi:hypothetical protein
MQRLHYGAFQQLMREARLHPDFTDFLRPVEIEQLSEATEKGLVTVLLSRKTFGAFTIIIRDRSPNAEKLRLSFVTGDDLQAMAGDLQVSVTLVMQEMRDTAGEGHGSLKLEKSKSGPKRTPNTMSRLWSTVGEPITRHLGVAASARQYKSVTKSAIETVLSDARHLTLGRG